MTKQDELNEMLEKKKIKSELHEWLSQYSGKEWKVYAPDIAVAKSERSEWGGSGGIGYWDQANVYYKGQVEKKEWNWRDRYDPRKDDYSKRIREFGEMKKEIQDDKVLISIQILNDDLYQGHRWTEFEFENIEQKSFKKLSEDEQEQFNNSVYTEIDRIMADLNRLWGLKPKMMVSVPGCYGGYTNYDSPKVKQQDIQKTFGVAAFVTVEQIDHDGRDPQYRYEVFIVNHKDQKAVRVYEDHSYENREGSALVAIVTLNPEEIVLNTRKGKKIIKIN